MEILNDNNGSDRTEKKHGLSPLHDFPQSRLNFRIPIITKIIFFLIGWLGLSLIATLVSLILVMTPYYDSEKQVMSPFGNSLFQFLTYLILTLIFIGILLFSRRKYFKTFISDFKDGYAYLFAIGGFFAILIVNIVFNSIFSLVPFYGENANQGTLESIMGVSPALSFFMIVLFGPFCEEMTYRLGLCDALSKKNRWIGIILSAVFFGFIHFDFQSIFAVMSNPNTENVHWMAIEFMNLPIYVASGIILAYVYAKAGKISSSLIAHIGVNLYSFLGYFILEALNTGNSASFRSLFSILIK